MDPNATVRRILAALDDNDPEEAREACFDLQVWLNRGGFLPTNEALLRDLLLRLLSSTQADLTQTINGGS